MLDTINAILNSKKFLAAIIMSLVIFCGQFFTALAVTGQALPALASVNWLEVATPILTAIGAQGIADFGKEKAKIEAMKLLVQPRFEKEGTGQGPR